MERDLIDHQASILDLPFSKAEAIKWGPFRRT